MTNRNGDNPVSAGCLADKFCMDTYQLFASLACVIPSLLAIHKFGIYWDLIHYVHDNMTLPSNHFRINFLVKFDNLIGLFPLHIYKYIRRHTPAMFRFSDFYAQVSINIPVLFLFSGKRIRDWVASSEDCRSCTFAALPPKHRLVL